MSTARIATRRRGVHWLHHPRENVAMPQAVAIGDRSWSSIRAAVLAESGYATVGPGHEPRDCLHRIKQALDHKKLPVEWSRKRPPHLGTHSVYAPSCFLRLARITLCAPSPCRISIRGFTQAEYVPYWTETFFFSV